jgi:hypothetical protein
VRPNRSDIWPEVDSGPDPARHELPAIDELGLAAALAADKLLQSARERGAQRWSDFLAPVPEQLRDGGVRQLLVVTQRARAAYGHKDSIREALPPEFTEPFLDALDRLRKAVVRELAER